MVGMHKHQSGSALGAAAYDWFTTAAFCGLRKTIYDRLASDAGIAPGDRVLDLGCGPGTLARSAAALAGNTGLVIGLDSSPEMVVRAQQHGVDARYGDAADADFTDGSFDVVVSALALHHVDVPDRDKVMAEAFRVLAPGGRVLFAEFVPPFGGLGMAVARRGFGEQIADDPKADLVERMGRAGFVDIETRGSGVLAVVRARRPQEV